MKREQIIVKLREHEAELKGEGIVRLSLFGSVACGDASAGSDVDLMAEFDAAKNFTILSRVRLENRIAASSKNSTKHGACARTLILPHESKQGRVGSPPRPLVRHI